MAFNFFPAKEFGKKARCEEETHWPKSFRMLQWTPTAPSSRSVGVSVVAYGARDVVLGPQ